VYVFRVYNKVPIIACKVEDSMHVFTHLPSCSQEELGITSIYFANENISYVEHFLIKIVNVPSNCSKKMVEQCHI